jgi:hypothetical protein
MQRAFIDCVAALGTTEIGLGVVEVDELAAIGQCCGGTSNPLRRFRVLCT